MTVLDLDPPQPALRLVSSTGQLVRDHRYRDSAHLYGSARDLYRDILQAALEWGATVDTDALRVVLATKQATSGAPARAFSSTGIWQLMFVDVVTWCRNRQLEVPTGCVSALTFALQYLETTQSFDELSDSPDSLFEALSECTGGWGDDPLDCTTTQTKTTQTKRSQSPSATRRLRSDRGPKRT